MKSTVTNSLPSIGLFIYRLSTLSKISLPENFTRMSADSGLLTSNISLGIPGNTLLFQGRVHALILPIFIGSDIYFQLLSQRWLGFRKEYVNTSLPFQIFCLEVKAPATFLGCCGPDMAPDGSSDGALTHGNF